MSREGGSGLEQLSSLLWLYSWKALSEIAETSNNMSAGRYRGYDSDEAYEHERPRAAWKPLVESQRTSQSHRIGTMRWGFFTTSLARRFF